LLTPRSRAPSQPGTYDLGLETLTAESFIVTDRQDHLHPSRHRRETRLLTITERERNRRSRSTMRSTGSMIRARLLVNEPLGPRRRAGAGHQRHARRWRDRTPRPADPADGAQNIPVKMMGETHWIEADRAPSPRPGRRTGRGAGVHRQHLHIVAGPAAADLEALPQESTRVYRLQTDDGERIIGRRVSPAWVANATSDRWRRHLTPMTPCGADRRQDHPRSRRGAATAPRPRHGRQPHRTDRLHRGDARAAAAYGLFTRSSRGSCACSCRRRIRAGFSASCWTAIPVERIAEREAA
jgi:hypothetical protein